jgi:hypothetical protein
VSGCAFAGEQVITQTGYLETDQDRQPIGRRRLPHRQIKALPLPTSD